MRLNQVRSMKLWTHLLTDFRPGPVLKLRNRNGHRWPSVHLHNTLSPSDWKSSDITIRLLLPLRCPPSALKRPSNMAYGIPAATAATTGSTSAIKQVKLDKECELRIEVGNETPLRLRLLSGTAEIFGTELPPEIWLTFPPRHKFAVPLKPFLKAHIRNILFICVCVCVCVCLDMSLTNKELLLIHQLGPLGKTICSV